MKWPSEKGIGHPDTLADGIAESISVAFSRATKRRFGAILNHWVDKVLVTGALGEIDFGTGVLKNNIRIFIFGKMSKSFGGARIEYKAICQKAIKRFLKSAVPLIDLKRNVEIVYEQSDYSKNPHWMNPRNIGDLPNATDPRANDSVVTVGYWPLSKIERLAFMMERYFYDARSKPKFSYIGQDIKILLVRKGCRIDITLCVPFIARSTPDTSFYFLKKEAIHTDLMKLAMAALGRNHQITIDINNADKMDSHGKEKRKGYYLLVTGTALDDGEVGVVGRGNPAIGVISSCRVHSVESPYGKNPVYHAGKVYTYVSQQIAEEIATTFKCEATVFITSKMGDRIDTPAHIIIETSKKIDEGSVPKMLDKYFKNHRWIRDIVEKEYFVPRAGGRYGHYKI